ncbi:MAG: Rpn family recombination-promoting nuclease/putative transposase [Spirochaetia bacterium]|jgi:hypothetical protein|nr:Rpn family recombination-promoting nuclease/putative transposase [Spirochaetia bacterium]
MPVIHDAKDNCYKLIFGSPELFAEFLRDFVPIAILKETGPEDIQDMSGRFLPGMHGRATSGASDQPLSQDARDSDTVKRVNLKNGGPPLFVIAIVEHESRVNHRASFKMLQYVCLVLDQYEKDADKERPGLSRTKGFRYPPVLPLIFYDGPGRWTAALNFAERTEGREFFGKHTPSFECLLVDMNRYPMEEVMGFRDTLSAILAVGKLPRRGGISALEGVLRKHVASLNIPKNLRKLITDVMTVLLGRAGFPREKAAAITDLVERKEVAGMFEGIVASIKDERRKAVREATEKTRAKTWAEACAKEEKKAYRHLLQSARKMKAREDSDEDIADILSLPLEDVAAL